MNKKEIEEFRERLNQIENHAKSELEIENDKIFKNSAQIWHLEMFLSKLDGLHTCLSIIQYNGSHQQISSMMSRKLNRIINGDR